MSRPCPDYTRPGSAGTPRPTWNGILRQPLTGLGELRGSVQSETLGSLFADGRQF